jgi:hypothetical protein
MSVYSLLVRAVLVAVVASPAAGAQQTWSPFIGLGSASSAGPLAGVSSASSLVVEPGAIIESARGSMLTRWSAPVMTAPLQLSDAELALRGRLWSGDRAEAALVATGQYDHALSNEMATANSTLRLQIGTSGAARGLQFGAGIDGWRSNVNRNAVVVPATTISGWIRRFGLAFSAEVSARSIPGASNSGRYSPQPDSLSQKSRSTRIDSLIPGGPFPPSTPAQPSPTTASSIEGHAFGDAALRVSGMLMSVGIDGHAGVGVASGGRARGFGSLILTRWISPGLAVTGGVVLQPPEPGSSARRTGGLLGIRLASGPRLFPHFVNAPKVGAASSTVRVVDGSVTIEVRAPSATHVEISGDFTRWLPAPLEHASGDRWTLTTRLLPGVHRFVVRVDGGSWLPAPGLAQTLDAYEGTVSVIVVP